MQQNMQEDSRQVIRRFLGLDRKRSGMELIHITPKGEWDNSR